MGVFIRRKRKDGKERIVVIPREAILMVELRGERVLVRASGYTEVEAEIRPEQVEDIKNQLLSFAEGKALRIVEEE
jgi:hypothetical protein